MVEYSLPRGKTKSEKLMKHLQKKNFKRAVEKSLKKHEACESVKQERTEHK